MVAFPLSKPMMGRRKKVASTAGNFAYALFVLFCFWAGAQILNLLVHAPGIYEHLMQLQDTVHPRVKMDLAVGTLFGLIPFFAGCLMVAVVALFLRWRRQR